MVLLSKIENLVRFENSIQGRRLSFEEYVTAKKFGYTDNAIRKLSGYETDYSLSPVYKMVDTCAGEFEAQTPYFYSGYRLPEEGGENEADNVNADGKRTVIVLGSGPIRIGQGIEFDYAAVHCAYALRKLGYRVVIINNNRRRYPPTLICPTGCILNPLSRRRSSYNPARKNPWGLWSLSADRLPLSLRKR
jgi:carbamoyl-phosphate synthase large subunit